MTMDVWVINFSWLVICLSGLLAAYMLCVHQRIRWQRQRGLLARDSYGLYWAVLGFLKAYYVWIALGLVLLVTVGLGYYALAGSSGKAPRRAVISAEQQAAANEEKPLDPGDLVKLNNWITRLEERRLDFPQDYCRRLSLGIAVYEKGPKAADSLADSKRAHLESEYQKHCPSSSGKSSAV